MTSLSPVVIVVIYLVLHAAAAAENAITGSSVVMPRAVEVLACAGTGYAALSFHADDPPRRPWMVFFIAMVGIPTARLLGLLELNIGDLPLKVPVLIVSNFIIIAALVRFGRVLSESGLVPEWNDEEHRSSRNVMLGAHALLVAAAIAILVVLFKDGLPTTTAEWTGKMVNTISTIADALICMVGLYLVWLVRPLMGGAVATPYILIAIGGAVFISVDFMQAVLHVTTQDELNSPIIIGVALTGWASFFLAGLAQGRMTRGASE